MQQKSANDVDNEGGETVLLRKMLKIENFRRPKLCRNKQGEGEQGCRTPWGSMKPEIHKVKLGPETSQPILVWGNIEDVRNHLILLYLHDLSGIDMNVLRGALESLHASKHRKSSTPFARPALPLFCLLSFPFFCLFSRTAPASSKGFDFQLFSRVRIQTQLRKLVKDQDLGLAGLRCLTGLVVVPTFMQPSC